MSLMAEANFLNKKMCRKISQNPLKSPDFGIKIP
jgi:hypothetical protein